MPSEADLIARWDAHAPRYTSYPTAAAFSPAVGAADWRAALAGLKPDRGVSLYVHLPFCKRLCWYCGCNTRAVNRRETIDSYVELLLQEADLVAAAVRGPLRIDRLHLGGGTPNMLPPETLTRLVQGLADRFDTSRLMEFAAELDPEVLTPEWIDAAGALGLTRASLGVQDLSPQVQAAVNRPETFDTIAAAAEGLRAAGVFSLNLDLMYGLPHQGVAEVEATLRQVLTLRPERLALFGYAHVPWMKPHQRLIDADALPGPEARFAMSRAAEALLGAAGYQTIGLDHFALPHDDLAAAARAGRLQRNFQGYTADEAETLIGLGASSISRTRDLYVQNAPAERDWRAAVGEGRLPAVRGVRLSRQDRFVAEVIARLMCDLSVDTAAVARRHGADVRSFAYAWPTLDRLEADGLIRQDGASVTITPRGRPFLRAAAAAFDPAVAPAEGRHARIL
ncbi:MAG TPA: oxygen-independent coproporphyrinogen III oxidase [Brevundimonas sp.]|jgi:oxygen-independent coproporphyrinogen-3 oxidase|uniref:oxygen-independent coproporphyrinogen III oxidase n=1 Tax=Brevundimonas sp. TaxID=1871086 RepID=UPI002E119EF9|nr:oxygen-independent coproporphyrinogen III oxidase [Brevundimonas sp.]